MDISPNFPAVLLGQEAVKKLNMLLSPADTLERDVRSLAGILGFSRDEIIYIFQKQYPFVYMLDQWLKRANDEATLRALKESLIELKRLDAAEIVETIIIELSDRDPKEIMRVLEHHHARQLKKSPSTTTLALQNVNRNSSSVNCEFNQQNSEQYALANVADLRNQSVTKRNVPEAAESVFVVYFPDDEQHIRNIKRFVKKMRKDGIDATADMFETMESAVDRGFYIYSRILEANYVLVVCSTLFNESHEHEKNHPAEEAPDRVREVSFIMKLILDEIYVRNGLNGKFIPILLAKQGRVEHVPFILKTSTVYKIPVDYEDLRRRIMRIEKYKLDPVNTKRPDLQPTNISDALGLSKSMSRGIVKKKEIKNGKSTAIEKEIPKPETIEKDKKKKPHFSKYFGVNHLLQKLKSKK